MKNIAIILAGGVGSRMGYSLPKQFLEVAGKTVIEHTIDAFESHEGIDEIAVVMNAACIAQMEGIIQCNRWRKVKKLLKGGSERYMSTLAAIEAYEGVETNLIFHDAVRPLVSRRIISDVLSALQSHEAVDVAVPATDTIVVLDADGSHISHIPPRALLRRAQTPQAFRMKVIKEAYRRALQDPHFTTTDDCGTVVKYMPEVPVYIVEGEEANIKLTYKEDTYLLDKLFQLRSTTMHEAADLDRLKG